MKLGHNLTEIVYLASVYVHSLRKCTKSYCICIECQRILRLIVIPYFSALEEAASQDRRFRTGREKRV